MFCGYSSVVSSWVNKDKNKKLFARKLFFYGDKYAETNLYSLVDLGLKYDFYLNKVGIHRLNKDFRWKVPVFFSHYDYYYLEDWKFYSITSAYRYIVYRIFFSLLTNIFKRSIFLLEKFFFSRYRFIVVFFLFFFSFLKTGFFSGMKKLYNQYIANLNSNRLSRLPLYFYKKILFNLNKKKNIFGLVDVNIYKFNIGKEMAFNQQLCKRNRFRFFLQNYIDYRFVYIKRMKGKFGFKGRLWKIVKRRRRGVARFIKKLSLIS